MRAHFTGVLPDVNEVKFDAHGNVLWPPPEQIIRQPPMRDQIGAIKNDEGKPPLHLLDRYALIQVANVLGHGAAKYEEEPGTGVNWRKGYRYTRLISAALRHIHAYNDGEDNDPSSGLPHIAHAMSQLMFLLNMANEHPEMDDRYKRCVN